MTNPAEKPSPATSPVCVICGKPLPSADDPDVASSPFCSDRCRQIDLGRWLGERYRFVTQRPSDLEKEVNDGVAANEV